MKQRKKSPPSSLLAFDHVVVLLNPAGTNVQRAQDYISQLRKLYPGKVTVIETSAKGNDATIQRIHSYADKLGEETLFCVAAGDGTVSLVVGLLAGSEQDSLPAHAQKSPLFPIWGGNANDLAYMLNGLASRTSLEKVLSEGQVQAIFPLAVTVEHEGVVTRHIAACYVSFGASATIADHLNRPEHRRQPITNILVRIIRELRMAQQIWRHAPTFAYTQDGRRRRAYEIVCANGSRIAKVDRLPARLAEHGFYVDSLEYKNLKWVGRKVVRVLQGKTLENIAHQPVVFKFRKPLLMQIDGEPTRLDGGTKVTVAVHEKPFYAVASALKEGQRPRHRRRPTWMRRHARGLSVTAGILLALTAFHAYLHLTNPYAAAHITQQPYTTYVDRRGNINYTKQFDLKVHDGKLANLLGYYKSGFLIVQNTLFGGKRQHGPTEAQILDGIHQARFDPSRPYLISGDQFSVLYIRNLGVFYNQLLDPNTARSQQDWESRQRIYLQSTLYALDTLSKSKHIYTTAVPIGPKSVAFTAVHPGSTGSDTVYGLLYALDIMATPATSSDGRYSRQTVAAAQQILRDRQTDLQAIVSRYITAVAQDDVLVRSNVTLAAARDGVHRTQSFYDSAVLWKTREITQKHRLLADVFDADIARQKLLAYYQSSETGCVRDELSKPASYGSDWLLAVPMGLLRMPQETALIAGCVDYIQDQKLADPLPIRYSRQAVEAPWAVRTFVPSYGTNAIWSYWGAEYITTLLRLNAATSDQSYRDQAGTAIRLWDAVIVRDGGFPETLDTNGKFLQSGVYKSIRTTGWVVQYEHAKALYTAGGTRS